jgi:hypothetical protein
LWSVQGSACDFLIQKKKKLLLFCLCTSKRSARVREEEKKGMEDEQNRFAVTLIEKGINKRKKDCSSQTAFLANTSFSLATLVVER